MKNSFLYLISVLILFAAGCAQQVGPTGGPKDTAPPEIVESEPLNFSTGFTGDKIKLRFDEFVQLKDLHTKLIVSPPLKELPELRIKGKTLEISFKDTLHPNTTYNFQFGEGIVDITEGNPLDSNLFVFSTGSKIDSLFVFGMVKNAFNLSPEKQVLVMLYSDFNDSLPYGSRPLYFAKTKDDGSFRINYLRAGKYKIFALKDGNGNYFFDMPDEPVGFLEKPVNAGDSSEVQLLLFEEDITKQFLKRAYAEHFGKIVFVLNKPSEKIKIVPLNFSFKKESYLEELSPQKDSLVYWLKETEGLDTLRLQVSEGSEILDTAEIILPEKEAKLSAKKRGEKSGFPEKLILTANAGSGPYDLYKILQIVSVHPAKLFDPSKITLVEKNDTVKIKPELADKAKRNVEIRHSWKESTEYSLSVLPGAFTDIYGLRNDSLKITFRTRKKEEYGVINLKVGFDNSAPGAQYIFQLMDKAENVVQEKIFSKGAVKFEKVIAGEYKIKLIYDRNKNSKWDTGNYLKKIQPEKVVYYSSKVELRPKFDLDVDWKINE